MAVDLHWFDVFHNFDYELCIADFPLNSGLFVFFYDCK